MSLAQIHLRNFRNFKDVHFAIGDTKITKIFGENGTGKTNLLEAIYLLYTTRSFRNRKTIRDCVSHGESYLHIQADINGQNHAISFILEGNEKKLFINQNAVKGPVFFQDKSILHFSPDETTVFFQSQENRRSLIDRYLCSLERAFFSDLLQFTTLKNRKNQVLSSQTRRKVELLGIDKPGFLRLSNEISEKRERFIQDLNPIFQNKVLLANPKLQNSVLRYKRKTIPEDFLEKEMLQQRILYGCQKDELEIQDGGRDIRHFYSNGEKKVVNLSIHFAFMEFLKNKRNQDCLACLDDIESELDHSVLKNLLRSIEESDSQFIITSKFIEKSTEQDILLAR